MSDARRYDEYCAEAPSGCMSGILQLRGRPICKACSFPQGQVNTAPSSLVAFSESVSGGLDLSPGGHYARCKSN